MPAREPQRLTKRRDQSRDKRAEERTTDAQKPRPAAPRKAAAAPRKPAAGSRVPGRALPANPVRSAAVEPMRLSKRMSETGLASRREADEWIERGWVRVEGQVAVLGTKWQPGQEITIDESARKQQARRLTVLLHKPVGYVSGQAEDGHQPASVLVLPETQWRPFTGDAPPAPRVQRKDLLGLAPAGRLDIDSTGLLVLTQDGRIAKQLIGDDSDVEKEYLVRVRYGKGGRLPEAELKRLNHGLSLDGKVLRPAHVTWQNEDQLQFILKEGRKRQIRRMCELVGLQVLGLKRVRIGLVRLGELPVGKWRLLAPEEKFAYE